MPSVTTTARIRYRTPLLKSTGPTLNHVSSLNSLVGEYTPLATDGALSEPKPTIATKKMMPANQTAPTAHNALRSGLIPPFSWASGVVALMIRSGGWWDSQVTTAPAER